MEHQAKFKIESFDARAYGRRALIAVWVTGIACIVSVILFLLLTNNIAAETYGKQIALTNTSAPQPVDELLLTSDDAFFSSNKAFMNTALVYRESNEKGSVEDIASDRTRMYKNIFNQKLSRVKRQHNGDFSVGPVPR